MSTDYELNQTPIEDWIEEGVSFLQANVTLYRNPSIYAEYQPLVDQIQALEKELAPKKAKAKRDAGLDEESLGDAPTEDSLGDDDLTVAMRARLEELYGKAEVLWAKYAEDTEVWTLRRLDEHEVQEVQKGMELPLPTAPGKPGAKPSKQMQSAYVKKFQAFIEEMTEYTQELNIRCLSLAVLKVVVKGEEKPPPSLDGLRRLKARPGGEKHIRELIAALESLAQEGVNIMAPHRSGTGA